MLKEIKIKNTSSLSKHFKSEAFINTKHFCIGSYTHENGSIDQYKSLLEFEVLTDSDGLLCFDSVILRLYNFYNPSENPQTLTFSLIESYDDFFSITWENCPSSDSSTMSHAISAGELEHKYLDIDITPLLRKGLCNIHHSGILMITGSTDFSNSIIYFDTEVIYKNPVLLTNCSSTSEAYALLVNESISPSSSDVLDVGRVYMGSYIDIRDSTYPDPEKIIVFDSPGIYEFFISLHSTETLDGFFTFKKGDVSRAIDEFVDINHIDFSAIHGSDFSLSVSIEAANSGVAVFYSEDHSTIDSLTITIKRISIESLIRIESSENPFTGGDMLQLDYLIYVDDNDSPITLGNTDSQTKIQGSVKLEGSLSNTSFILLENLVITEELKVSIGSGRLYINNCTIDNIKVISCDSTLSGICILEDCFIGNVDVHNVVPVKLSTQSHEPSLLAYDSSTQSSSKIESIHLQPDAPDFTLTTITLDGDYGKCSIYSDKSSSIIFSSFNLITPMEIALKDSYDTLMVDGDLNGSKLCVSGDLYLVGSSDFQNGFISIDSSESHIIIEGEFSSSTVESTNCELITVKENTNIGELSIGVDSENVTITLEENIDIQHISLLSTATYAGDLDSLLSLTEKTELLSETASFSIDSASDDLDKLVSAVNFLEKKFINPISEDFTIDSLEEDIKDISEFIEITLNSLTYSSSSPLHSFTLSGDNSSIIFTLLSSNSDYPIAHEAHMNLALTLNGSIVNKSFLIRGVYSDVSIDYPSSYATLSNSSEILDFYLAYDKITRIVLLEDFTQWDYTLLLSKRNIYIDLNSFSLSVGNISISDSQVIIKDGRICPCITTDSWFEITDSNGNYNKVFCYIKEYSHMTDATFDNITISLDLESLSFDQSYLGSFTLIQGGCCLDFYALEHLILSNSVVSFTDNNSLKRDDNTFCIFSSFAKESHVEVCTLSSFHKTIYLGTSAKELDTTVKISSNHFNSPDSAEMTAIEVVPYNTTEFSSLFINGEEIPSNLTNRELVSKILALRVALASTVPNIFSENTFSAGSSIVLWQNQNKLHYESLQFNGVDWTHLAAEISIYGTDHINMLTTPNETLQILYTTIPEDSEISPRWSVSDNTIIEIDSSGLVKALDEGVATVILTDLKTGINATTSILVAFSDSLLPPELYADSVTNNLLGSVFLYYDAMNYWVKNIHALEIVNSQVQFIPNEFYMIDNDNLRIRIDNVVFSNNNTPKNLGFFQVGYNTVIVHATHFESSSVLQKIDPRQIIHVSDGSSSAQMCFNDGGTYTVHCSLYTDNKDYPINSEISIMVVEEFPKHNSVIANINSEVYVIFPHKISSFESASISISSQTPVVISPKIDSASQNKLQLNPVILTSGNTYEVFIPKNSVTLESRNVDVDIRWTFEIS